jgi:hypothetical protein
MLDVIRSKKADFGPISETVYIDIILNTIIER